MGGLSCGASCAKYILFVFNFIFFLIGAALLAIGIYVKVDPHTNDLLEVLEITGSSEQLHTASIAIIILGCLIFIVGFFGCCGACKESTCMLCVYAILVAIIFILQIGCAVIAVISKGSIGDDIRKSMEDDVMKNVHNDTEDAVTRAYYVMQYDLKCCGSNGPEDYVGSVYRNETVNTTKPYVPVSCCRMDQDDDFKTAMPEDNAVCQLEAAAYSPGHDTTSQLFTKGCYAELKEELDSKAFLLIAITIGLAIIEILGIVMACCLRKAINIRDGV